MRERLAAMHGRVQGETSAGMAGPSRYSAFEPELLFWVLATLIDASIQGYEFVWGPLALERRERFYRDFRPGETGFRALRERRLQEQHFLPGEDIHDAR